MGGGGEKQPTVKKVVIIRSGDNLSKILIQAYGEYTKSVVDLVVEANPGLRNIERSRDRAASDFARAPGVSIGTLWQMSNTLPPPPYPSLTPRRQDVEYVVLADANDTAETNLLDYVRLIWRRKWLLLLPLVCIMPLIGLHRGDADAPLYRHGDGVDRGYEPENSGYS